MSLPPLRWMIRRDLHAAHEDPMLPRGTRKCWCAECGLYFNATSGFAAHLTKTSECVPVRTLRSMRWTQGPLGHWLMPAEQGERWAQMRHESIRVSPFSGDLQNSAPVVRVRP